MAGLINLDACLLIYLIENDRLRAPAILAAMSAASSGETPHGFAVSPLVKMECLVKPLKSADFVLQARYEESLSLFVQLPMPEAVFLQAAKLRASFGLKTADTMHLACAQHHHCAALWTNDNRLAQAGHGLAVNIVQPA